MYSPAFVNNHRGKTYNTVFLLTHSTTMTDRKQVNTCCFVFFSLSPCCARPCSGFRREPRGNTGRWSEEEHELFLRGYNKYGRDWVVIRELFVTTRTDTQIRTHAQKFFKNVVGRVQHPRKVYGPIRWCFTVSFSRKLRYTRYMLTYSPSETKAGNIRIIG